MHLALSITWTSTNYDSAIMRVVPFMMSFPEVRWTPCDDIGWS